MEDLQDREEVKKKVEAYFTSGNEEMVKLGRTICHAMRIDYYVLVSRLDYFSISRMTPMKVTTIKKVVKYSVHPFPDRAVEHGIYRTYQIKLEKWS